MSSLKIKPEHIEVLALIITSTAINNGHKFGVRMSVTGTELNAAIAEVITAALKEYAVRGIGKDTVKRCHFDLFYASLGNVRDNIMPRIHEYANDDNVYSALRHITKNIEKYASINAGTPRGIELLRQWG